MTTQAQNGIPQGSRSRSWRKLETASDVQRFLRFLILETKAGRIDTKRAAVLGQLSCYLLRAIEVGDLEERILKLEGQQEDTPENRTIHITVGGVADAVV